MWNYLCNWYWQHCILFWVSSLHLLFSQTTSLRAILMWLSLNIQKCSIFGWFLLIKCIPVAYLNYREIFSGYCEERKIPRIFFHVLPLCISTVLDWIYLPYRHDTRPATWIPIQPRALMKLSFQRSQVRRNWMSDWKQRIETCKIQKSMYKFDFWYPMLM